MLAILQFLLAWHPYIHVNILLQTIAITLLPYFTFYALECTVFGWLTLMKRLFQRILCTRPPIHALYTWWCRWTPATTRTSRTLFALAIWEENGMLMRRSKSSSPRESSGADTGSTYDGTPGAMRFVDDTTTIHRITSASHISSVWARDNNH